ncbi:arylmalonate decarboxylase [Streptomyces sp. NPDC058417]|uniref:maleate cis-trans isomerase family protein n=1 Tax=unclassified Streptomyces TaxID=2593676 RepID=UPI0036584EFB
MDPFAFPRLGVVVPPENPTAEPEFHRLLGAAIHVHTARFPTTPGAGLKDMLETYNRVLPDTLDGFGALRLDAAVIACSASHYLLGPRGDRELCEALSERAGFPVRSSTQATLAACEALGVRRLTLVSPYEPWLTGVSRRFWEAAGLTVDRVVLVPADRDADGADHFDPYRVTPAALRERIRAELGEPGVAGGRPGASAGGSAVLFTGTGMGTLAALEEWSTAGTPPLSSNLASAWWARHAVRTAIPSPEAHPLVRRIDVRSRAAA